MQLALAGQQSVNQTRDRNQGGPETCSETRGPVMKLYFLYLLIASIALLAHLGARKQIETETEKAPV